MTQDEQSDKNQSWVGIDVGAARIGVAVATSETRFAVPKCTATSVEEVAEIIADLEPTAIVVGWPLELDGTEGRATRSVDKFLASLTALLEDPPEIFRWDERMTTTESEHLLREAGKRAKQQRAVIDQVAATTILQSYLDAETANG